MKLADEFAYLKWVENIEFIDKYKINFLNSYKTLFSVNKTVNLWTKYRVVWN